MIDETMDRATQDRLIEGVLVFFEQEGVVLPLEDEPEGEYHCWSCDALKRSPDAACPCDYGFSDAGRAAYAGYGEPDDWRPGY
jgi:hypothetical protein